MNIALLLRVPVDTFSQQGSNDCDKVLGHYWSQQPHLALSMRSRPCSNRRCFCVRRFLPATRSPSLPPSLLLSSLEIPICWNEPQRATKQRRPVVIPSTRHSKRVRVQMTSLPHNLSCGSETQSPLSQHLFPFSLSPERRACTSVGPYISSPPHEWSEASRRLHMMRLQIDVLTRCVLFLHALVHVHFSVEFLHRCAVSRFASGSVFDVPSYAYASSFYLFILARL